MSNIKNSPQKSAKKSTKQKWREIEAIRDRHQLMKELREDDYCWEMDVDQLKIS